MSNLIQHFELFGFRCRYKYIGDGNRPVTLLLAGAMQEIETLDSLVSLFRSFDVMIVELPGQGRAQTLEPAYSCSFLAECLEEFVSRYVTGTYFLFSYSYANLITLEFLKFTSQAPQKTIIAAGMAELEQEQRAFIQRLIELPPERCVEAFVDFITAKELTSRKQALLKRASSRFSLRYMKGYPDHFHNNTKRLLKYRARDISELRSDCIVIGGQLDPFVRPEFCKSLADRIKGCRHATIEYADHLFYLQQPEKTSELIRNFFY